MNWKTIDRLVAGAVFLYALVLYLLTVAPVASFWDAGEFIAIAHGLQVSHPPGAPFYMLIGRLFSLVFAPVIALVHDAGSVALAINLVSVLSSALTILLTHLIIVRLVREWQGPAREWLATDRIIALAGGVIGATAFAVTDSFWFNAVEAEVYAMSMLFTAAVVWLVMKWSEQAREEEKLLAGGQHPFGLRANRYLVVIAYLFGLAIGVHLLNLLAIFFVGLIFYFSEIERPDWDTRRIWTGIVGTGLVSAAVFLVIYPGIIQWLPTLAGRLDSLFLTVLLVVGLVVFGIYYTQKNQLQVANLALLSLAMVLIGYSTYTLIFIRSAADPPIDENDPETTEAIISYLKREQYGQTPLFKGPTYSAHAGGVDYNDETFLPRRWSPDPLHARVYAQYDSDWEFFWDYQVGHMYVRYFLWNFVGRSSDVQDAPPITGFAFVDERIEVEEALLRTPSEQASRNAYFALPLLLGLLGAGFHFSRDWRRFFSVLILFLVTGLGIIVYLNQPPMQPRERDYSYVASFFAFSLWIGIGAAGLLEVTLDALKKTFSRRAQSSVLVAVSALVFLAVPFWMLLENYADHDRSGRYVAPEYAYNMLMSLDDHAIVFTNGDNDTFPLWYLQEVEGVRQDVRVVNLSLLNTPWYVRQLKEQQARASAPLPISLSDDQIAGLSIVRWEPTTISLPVPDPAVGPESEVFVPPEDTAEIQRPMTWHLEGRPYTQDINVLYAADLVALDILRTNAQQGWERPVYFAVTVSPSGQLDLQNYFQLEGQAFRVVPIEHDEPMGRVVPDITLDRLQNFRFTNIADEDVYYDENIRRMVDNYRNIYGHVAQELAEMGRSEDAVALLDRFTEEVPFRTIPGDVGSYMLLARAYQQAGAEERSVELMKMAEPLVLHRLETASTSQELDLAARYVQMMQYSYVTAEAFEAASEFTGRIADVIGDSTYRQTPDDLRRRAEQELGTPVAPPGS